MLCSFGVGDALIFQPGVQLGQALHDLPGLPARRGVEPGGGLVQEEQFRVADEGHPDVEAPLLAPGERRDAGVLLRAQADELDHLFGRPRVRVVAGVHGEDLGDGQVTVDPRGLQHDTDVRLQRLAFVARVVPEHRHLALVPMAEALQDLDRRRLAGAVRPQQREDLAPGDLEVHPVDRLQGPVRLAQPPDRNRCLLGRGAGGGATS